MPFMIVMCPGFHDHYASISAENRELDQESRLSLIGPKIQHKTCSHSIYAWEIRNWHCGACGALGGAFPPVPTGSSSDSVVAEKKGSHWGPKEIWRPVGIYYENGEPVGVTKSFPVSTVSFFAG